MDRHDATEIAFKNGYKKAAEEIFSEIEEFKEENLGGEIHISRYEFSELKKKYTGVW